MSSALGTKRALAVAMLGIALASGCARWQPAKNYDVPTQADPSASYATVLEVTAAKQYSLVAKDDAAKTLRLISHTNDRSFIDIDVMPGDVRLAASGELVRDGKVHKALSSEISKLQKDLKQRFASGEAPAPLGAAPLAPTPAEPVAAAPTTGTPTAWTEPAYDPSVWGNGNFTCLPVRVPADHQGTLSLQLTNGEKADLQLSLAYDQGLCRSPAQCKQAGGCPALGIGDADRVNRLAARLSRGEIGAQATLLDAGKPVATIDLAHHGSIVQAMADLKKK